MFGHELQISSSFEHHKHQDLHQLNHQTMWIASFQYVDIKKVEIVNSDKRKVEITYSIL